jgi:hypothetical protein
MYRNEIKIKAGMFSKSFRCALKNCRQNKYISRFIKNKCIPPYSFNCRMHGRLGGSQKLGVFGVWSHLLDADEQVYVKEYSQTRYFLTLLKSLFMAIERPTKRTLHTSRAV